MSLNRSVFVIFAALLSASTIAKADTCILSDGRSFETDVNGNVYSPIELTGFLLRERDDLAGLEIIRRWSSAREVLLVNSCVAGSGDFGDGWNHGGLLSSEGRDSGGHCQSKNSDGTCNEE